MAYGIDHFGDGGLEVVADDPLGQFRLLEQPARCDAMLLRMLFGA
jgi:hypothetical protein